MSNTEQTARQDGLVAETAAILGEVTQAPAPGDLALATWNPMESIPTLSVGVEGDIKPGMTVTGYFVRNEVIASPKFTHSKVRNAQGVPTQVRHVLRATNSGKLFGIWTCGELKMAFEKLEVGEALSLKYIEKGVNSKGQAQHFFEYLKGGVNTKIAAQETGGIQ
jgi:hypothetical protein